jgi:hypothetical protein
VYAALSLCLAVPAWAQRAPVSPVKLEKLLTGVGGFRLDTALSLASERQTQAQAFQLPSGTETTELVALSQHQWLVDVGLSYGVSKGLNLTLSTALAHASQSASGVLSGATLKESSSNWGGLSLGLSYQVMDNPDTKTSVILSGSLDVARLVAGNGGSRRVTGRSGQLAINVQRVVDPVVFSVTSEYVVGPSVSLGQGRVKLGHAITFKPSVSLQINERVAVGLGVAVVRSGRGVDSSQSLTTYAPETTSTSLTLSSNYQLSKDSAVQASVGFPIGGSGPGTLSLRMSQDF